MDVFHFPTTVDKFSGEPVEQFRMAGSFAQLAEVIWGGDNAGAKVVLPDSIGDDAGRERVVAIGNPVSESGAASGGGFGRGYVRG